jgi:two-component system, NtrC family, nitrogen regulation sensor histidine kinase NtrY
MKGNRHILILGFLTVIMIAASFISESIYFSDVEYRFRTKKFNRILGEKERIMEECLNDMKPILAREDHHGSMTENNLFFVAEQNKITILEYIDNKLVYWSDNDFDVPQFINDSIFSRNLVFFQNGWFLPKTIKAGNEIIVGLLRIRTEYGFENDIIKSGFEKEFKIPESVGFSTDRSDSDFHISDKNGNYLFSLIFPEIKVKTYFIFIPLFLWLLAFSITVILILELAKVIVAGGRSLVAVGFVFLSFSLIYASVLFTGKPSVLFQTELFSPYRFSYNDIIPSLGHLLLLSILAAAFSNVFYRHFPLKEIRTFKGWKDFLFITALLIPGALLVCLYHMVFKQLISTSNINFETYKVLEISMFSVVGFTAAILLVLVPVLYLMKIFQSGQKFKSATVLLSIIASVIVIVVVHHNDPGTLIPMSLFYFIVTVSVWRSVQTRIGLFNMAVIFSLIFGIYSLYFITILSDEKTTDNLKIKAVSLSTENDPDAEHLFLDLWPVISKDTLLKAMMQPDYFDKDDVDKISRYLQENYFSGYWNNFNFNIVLCRDDESLRVGPGNEIYENCFTFFDERIRRDGHKLTGTEFYFIDNQGGRSYYLGRLFYNTGGTNRNGLFIELYSDINVFQPGYSELLLDKKYHGYSGIKDYSFAKYINGELVLSTGDFAYDKTDAEYVDKIADYRVFDTDGYRHVLYKNGNATILITRPVLTFGDIIISFAYIFAYVLLFSNLFILMIRRPVVKKPNVLNFRQKLQFSFIGILLFSFLLIGIVVAYLTVNQFHSKHYENIKEKLNSIYQELDNRLSLEKQLSTDLRNNSYTSLNELLIKLSNTFNTDINLYDLNGFLIATSRPEIFYRNLTSRRINNMAFINLANLTKSEYIQKEKVGSLEYISAYVPFIDRNKKVIAYLNLPYFRMQSILAREISNLIVAIINFTLLLIVITMSMAVLISGRLTSPLMMLGEGLASVGVGKKSEHLVYRGSDEIGELVKQYNRMVDEIEESTHKLANSEREFAWREMAKQIAHEIKNPLTPMKLNVQQLFKSWKDKAPGFDKLLERFTKNQIEYIDNLSSIATAFSSFAKMPGNNPVEINLLDQIKTTLELFKNTDGITFSVNWPHESKVMIYADREHLNSVFANLIKNGIQSIPAGKEGSIKVDLEIQNDKVIVSISDNGSGISDDLRKKLFTPNFTTKSSGMGLGLSIAKRYIENANGRIWFESEADKGSVFYVELPLIYTVEKLG